MIVALDRDQGFVVVLIRVETPNRVHDVGEGLRRHTIRHVEGHLLLGLLNRPHAVHSNRRTVFSNPVCDIDTDHVAAWAALAGALIDLQRAEEIVPQA